MKHDLIRRKVLNFLQWNDKNGYYTDKRCDLEGVPRMTYEDSIKYFFRVINSDFYYTIADNIFELNFNEVIKVAKDNGFYFETKFKLNLLLIDELNNPFYLNSIWKFCVCIYFIFCLLILIYDILVNEYK